MCFDNGPIAVDEAGRLEEAVGQAEKQIGFGMKALHRLEQDLRERQVVVGADGEDCQTIAVHGWRHVPATRSCSATRACAAEAPARGGEEPACGSSLTAKSVKRVALSSHS